MKYRLIFNQLDELATKDSTLSKKVEWAKKLIQMINSTKRWSREHDTCVKCGKTKYRHVKNGLCCSCYMAEYNKNRPERKKNERGRN